MPKTPRHERLTAWQATDALAYSLFEVSFSALKKDPDIADELRTSAVAAVNHIVMGTLEPDRAGFRRELNVAVGKLMRIGSAWEMVRELELVKPDIWGEIEAKRDHAERLVRGLYVALGRKGTGTAVPRRKAG
jgi:hypothetical protein